MAAKKAKKFSVDEYLAEYKGRTKRGTESMERLAGALDEKREARVEKAAKEDDARGRGYEPEGWVPPEKKAAESGFDVPEGAKEVVTSKLLILFTYLLRSFAISVMAFLMLFVILHDVMGKRSVIAFFSYVSDSFVAFISDYVLIFLLLCAGLFALQAAYYLFHKVASRKWKAYAREEIVYSIAFALVGLLGSAAVVYALGLY